MRLWVVGLEEIFMQTLHNGFGLGRAINGKESFAAGQTAGLHKVRIFYRQHKREAAEALIRRTPPISADKQLWRYREQ